jgi:hypothetical protein
VNADRNGRSNVNQDRNGRTNGNRNVDKNSNFSRGVARASSPVPSTEKSFDVNDSLNTSVDWKYKEIPLKNAVMMLNEMFPPPSVNVLLF